MKDDQGIGLTEGWGGFLGLIDGLAHVGRDPWCSRGPHRDPVVAIFQWEDTHTGTIGGLDYNMIIFLSV